MFFVVTGSGEQGAVAVTCETAAAVLSHYPEYGSEACRWTDMIKSVSYKRHRFPREIIARAVWLYFRFPLSLRWWRNCFWSAAFSSPMKRSGDGL